MLTFELNQEPTPLSSPPSLFLSLSHSLLVCLSQTRLSTLFAVLIYIIMQRRRGLLTYP